MHVEAGHASSCKTAIVGAVSEGSSACCCAALQLEALSCKEQSLGFCKSLLGAGADSWLAAESAQQPAAPTPSSRPFAALFGA